MVLATSAIMASGSGANNYLEDPYLDILEAVQADTLPPIEERDGDFITDPSTNPFDLTDPTVIQQEVEYDAESGMYIITEKIGEEYYKEPTYMSFEEYLRYSEEKQRQEYFDRLSRNAQGSSGASGKKDPVSDIEIPNNLLDKLFGGTKIDIKPQGNIDLTLGADYQKVDNPIIPERQRQQGGFDFDMNIQMNVTGSIGDKLKLGTSYNTQATFDFENQMKLEYAGGEDDIIQKIEAGNVSLPLKSSLIQGSQSLFGIKTELKFGRMTLTGIASQQKSRRNEIQIQGGSQIQTFDVTADSYDENRHFFLSHYNRGAFENALENMPQVNSLFKINRMEVWVTNTRNQTENVRDIVALADLAEGRDENISNPSSVTAPPIPANPDIYNNPLPTNAANDMFDAITTNDFARSIDGAVSTLQTTFGLQQARDFEKVSARMLSPNEYSFHPDLGFVSLNVTLQPEDVLGVAIEYTYNGIVYKVGEFTNDVPIDPEELNVLYVKMLKSTTPRVDIPMWDLMMKNVYSIGAFQVSQEDFLLDIFYEDPGGGEKRFLPATGLVSKPLLEVFNLDNLNGTLDPQPDGRFDFVEGITINSRNGRVMFPKLEPFGSALQEAIVNSSGDPTNPSIIAEANQYTYQQLYDSTIVVARQYPEFNRFAIRGSYRSSVSSEISLGAFNIPRGSVVVIIILVELRF
jgi:cell surface protein SprA